MTRDGTEVAPPLHYLGNGGQENAAEAERDLFAGVSNLQSDEASSEEVTVVS